jgi:hypothetical protein
VKYEERKFYEDVGFSFGGCFSCYNRIGRRALQKQAGLCQMVWYWLPYKNG